jgi:uncharacterized protein (TIGR02466 family)
MQIKLDQKKDLFTLFPTKVGWVSIPNADSINPGLEAAILRRMDDKTGVHHSNIGGWQSTADFVDWPEKEAIDIVDSFRSAVINMIGLTSKTETSNVEMFVGAWANVNEKSNFNQVHTHPENTWSGVYYVKAGDYSQDAIGNPGRIHLHDPRERVDMLVHPGSKFGKPVAIAPADGLMLLFPSWLGHSVNVFYSETTRISIAFNAQITQV